MLADVIQSHVRIFGASPYIQYVIGEKLPQAHKTRGVLPLSFSSSFVVNLAVGNV